MLLCGMTKRQNTVICCNIFAEAFVKTHFHKRSRVTPLLKEEQDLYLECVCGCMCVSVCVGVCLLWFLFPG